LRALVGAALVFVAAVLTAGCGTGGPASGGNVSSGKKLFLTEGKCGGCHTLADAGSRGQVGPNLDEAFAATRADEIKESTIRNVVLDQIRYPTSESGMPADLVRGQDAEDVAAYVSSVAGTQPVGGPAPGGSGKDLYASLGCQGCHTLDGTKASGPSFKGLFDSKVTLTNGQTVTADEAYLLEAIIDPDKQIVQGYAPGVMTSVITKGQVSQADAKKLVQFIKAQK
jgi:mono/diheme cytochrome c family protein